MKRKILVYVAGLNGAIGSTLAAAVLLANTSDRVYSGMVTDLPKVKALFNDFIPLESLVVSGWDIQQRSQLEAVWHHGIIKEPLIDKIKTDLESFIPREAYVPGNVNLEKWIQQEARDINETKKKSGIDTVIFINACPTEPRGDQLSDLDAWENLKLLTAETKGITPSRIYLRLAIEVGAHFINFTPNIVETDNLTLLAKSKGILFCGRDGKTGQTFLKTVIAPALRDRNLQIDGWFSTNILGNSDGFTLSDEDCLKSKQLSKSSCLESILGYNPGGEEDNYSHQVQIHYYPPRGDAKEAWDSIDFSGFLGEKMQMKINWLGKDSILAVPSLFDLVRLVDAASRNQEHGALDYLSYFFKTPVVQSDSNIVHETQDQFNMLLNHIKTMSTLPKGA